MIIRVMQETDIQELAILGKQLLDIHTTFDSMYYTLEENFTTLFSDWLRNQLSASSQIVFVAEEGSGNSKGEIIGFISGFIKSLYPWFKVKAVGHVSYLVVDHKYRKQHIGKQLEVALTSWFCKKGVSYIEVYTDEKNQIGVYAWSSYGYEPFKKYLRKRI
ncbi:GNAT family N-acetyltransferase [Candidatus Gottesmanbacteria bacterium]|nr:GNAT family N-acetyltransferase [Candidatus Gottesmanbacteria bacterium]